MAFGQGYAWHGSACGMAVTTSRLRLPPGLKERLYISGLRPCALSFGQGFDFVKATA